MATRERFDRNELKQPDTFFETFGAARLYVDENRGRVIAGVVGVAVLIASVTAFTGYRASSRAAAAADFARAVANLEFDSPSAAVTNLTSLAERSNAGTYGRLAPLYRASLATSAGQHDDAIAAYDEFLGAAPAPYLRQVGLMGKAHALEQAGKAGEAAAALEQAAGIEGPYRAAALTDRARLAEAAGDRETAISILEQLLELGGSSAETAAIERRLEALRPKS